MGSRTAGGRAAPHVRRHLDHPRPAVMLAPHRGGPQALQAVVRALRDAALLGFTRRGGCRWPARSRGCRCIPPRDQHRRPAGADGLVAREPHPSDGRAAMIVLTAEGRALVSARRRRSTPRCSRESGLSRTDDMRAPAPVIARLPQGRRRLRRPAAAPRAALTRSEHRETATCEPRRKGPSRSSLGLRCSLADRCSAPASAVLNSGARFSRKAAMPSFWSAVANSAANTWRSNRRPSRERQSPTRRSAPPWPHTPTAATSTAIASATLQRLLEQVAAGTTRETSPERSASAASIMRPVSTSPWPWPCRPRGRAAASRPCRG